MAEETDNGLFCWKNPEIKKVDDGKDGQFEVAERGIKYGLQSQSRLPYF
jgi:hypothetical protein